MHGDEQGRCTGVRERTEKAEYSNTRRMCPPLAALDLTLKLQEVGKTDNFQMEVMDRLRGTDVDLKQLAGWASRMLMEYGAERGRDMREMDGLDPDLLSYIGLSINTFSKAHEAIQEESLVDLCRKRKALQDLDPGPKWVAIGQGHVELSIQITEHEPAEPIAEDFPVRSTIGKGELCMNHAEPQVGIES